MSYVSIVYDPEKDNDEGTRRFTPSTARPSVVPKTVPDGLRNGPCAIPGGPSRRPFRLRSKTVLRPSGLEAWHGNGIDGFRFTTEHVGKEMLWSFAFGTGSEEEKEDVGVLKTDRERCYAARDAYYKCADAAGAGTPGRTSKVSPGQLIHKKCAKKRAEYEKLCKGSWVRHFDKLRDKHLRLEEITGPGR